MSYSSPTYDEALRQHAVNASAYAEVSGSDQLDAIVRQVAATYKLPFAAVSIIDGDRQVLISRTGTDITETPRTAAFCAVAIHRPGETLLVPDALNDSRFSNFATVRGSPHVRFYAGMPIVSRDGYPLGALCVADTKPSMVRFDPTELTMLARQAERLLWR